MDEKKKMKLTKNVLAASVFLLATSAQSGIITQFGTDVSYTYDDSTFFGLGTVTGNNIFFTPDAFVVESLDGAGFSTLSDTINIDVDATTSGFNLTSFLLVENGDYRLSGVGADVDVTANFKVTSNTNLFGCGGLCQDEFFATAGALADTSGVLTAWSLSDSIDLANTVGWGSDSSVNITLQNNVLAETTSVGEIAFIQKKFGAIGVTINPVPVPAAIWLFGSGLLGLVAVARRKQS